MAEKNRVYGWLIRNITEASKNARKIYLLFIGILIYCAFTVISTSDEKIVLNQEVRLPILQFSLSLSWFFILALTIPFFVFIYLQLYLDMRKDLISDLPKYKLTKKRRLFKEDKEKLLKERKRLYPWIMNSLNYPKPGFMGIAEKTVAKFSLWWSLPFVLILIAWLCIKKHDPFLSYVAGTAPIIVTVFVLWFWSHYENIEPKIKELPKNYGKIILAFFVIIFEIFLVFTVIPRTMEGEKIRFLGKLFFVDLSHKKLIAEPGNDYEGIYWCNLNKAHLEGANLTNSVLTRADLRGAHLQNASIQCAFLEKASLEEANLQGANFIGATGLTKDQLHKASNWILAFYSKEQLGDLRLPSDHNERLKNKKMTGYNFSHFSLRSSKLIEFDLQNANLQVTDMRKADLRKANLEKANMQGADLREANLREANLQGANLGGTNLEKANLEEANLQGANFVGATGLTEGQLPKAWNWVLAFYSEKQRETLELQILLEDHNTRLNNKNLAGYKLNDLILRRSKLIKFDLTNAELQGADLTEAELQGANLENADLRGADLKAANLQGVNLKKAKITFKQLSKVKTLYKAKLDQALFEKIKKKHPELLEEPKSE